MDIRGCISCNKCLETGKCIFNDLVNETAPDLEAVDGVIIGTPVYYGGANGQLHAFLDRLFFSTTKSIDKTRTPSPGYRKIDPFYPLNE